MSLTSSQSKEECSNDSWVKLEVSSAVGANHSDSVTGPQSYTSFFHQGELERILFEAQQECESNSIKSSPAQVSPQRTPSPQEDGVERCYTDSTAELEDWQHGVGVVRQTDWVRDWSSQPERQPPKPFISQRPEQTGSLNTEKNEAMTSGFLFSEFFLLLIPALLTSHLLTLGLGIYLGQRLASSSTSSL